MKFIYLSLTLISLGIWLSFQSIRDNSNIPVVGKMTFVSFLELSGKERWRLIWECDEQEPCPHLKQLPEFPISSEWLQRFSQGLKATRQYPLEEISSNGQEREHEASQYMIHVGSSSGEQRRFRIGGYNPLVQSYYLFEETEALSAVKPPYFFLVSESFVQALNAQKPEMIERRVLRDIASASFIRKCSIVLSDGQPLDFMRDGDDWSLNGRSADTPFVEELLRGIVGLQYSGKRASQLELTPHFQIILEYQNRDGTSRSELIRIMQASNPDNHVYYAQPGYSRALFPLEELPRMMRNISKEMFLK